VRGVGVSSQAKPGPALSSQETFSKDSAGMEETCAKVTFSHSGRGTTESRIQHCENIAFNHVCSLFLVLQVKKKR
jgi:hypothetical protein